MKQHIIVLFLIAVCFGSCRKYVDIVPKGKIIPQETRDYRLLLNNANNKLLEAYGTQEIMTDNIDYSKDPVLENSLGLTIVNLFTFAPQIYQDNQDDPEWNNMYAEIYTANVVINQVMQSTGGSEVEKQQLKGEALLLRAHNYWALVNIYAKLYNAATAATDVGIPLVLQPDLQADLVRKPIQDVYNQIMNDLDEAVLLLPTSSVNNYAPSKSSAFAMLSRTMLMMRDFVNAEHFADSALKYRNTLFDLNLLSANSKVWPINLVHPEIIYLRNAGNPFATMFLSTGVLNLLGTKDLRAQLFTGDGKTTRNFYGVTYYGEFLDYRTRNVGPTVPEMMLVKAECMARAGKKEDAIEIVNQLRQKRFKPAEYEALTAATPELALQIVIDERRREMFCLSARWFDLKRLSKDADLATTVTHTFKGNIYSLPPGSNLYTYPIPPRVKELNPEILSNPR